MDWYSKKQKTTETATYGSVFLACQTVFEHLVADRNYLRYLGVPIENVSYVFGDNESQIGSCVVPESKLNKRHNILSYHFVRNIIACKFVNLQHIASEWNMADVVSKHWSYQKVQDKIIKPILHFKGDTGTLVNEYEYGVSDILELFEDPEDPNFYIDKTSTDPIDGLSMGSDKSNFTLGELASTGILETLSEFLNENSLSTDLGEKKSKRVRFSCDNENPCKIAHTT